MPLSPIEQAKIRIMLGTEENDLLAWLGEDYPNFLASKKAIEDAGGEAPKTVLSMLAVKPITADALHKNQDAIIAFCDANTIPLYNIGIFPSEKKDRLLDALAGLIQAPSQEGFSQWCQSFHDAYAEADVRSRKQHELDARHGETVHQTYERTGSKDYEALMAPQELELLLYHIDRELGRVNQNTDLIRAPLISVSEPVVDSTINIIRNLQILGDEKTLFVPALCNGHYFYLTRKNMLWSIHDSLPLGAQKTPLQEAMIEGSEKMLREITGIPDLTCTFQSSNAQKNGYDCATQVTNAYGRGLMENYPVKNHRQHIDIVFDFQEKAEHHAVDASEPVMTKPAVVPVPIAAAPLESKHTPVEEMTSEVEKARTESLLRANPSEVARATIKNKQSFFQNVRDLYTHKVEHKIDEATLELLSSTSNEDLEKVLKKEGIKGISDEDLAIILQEKELKSAYKKP